MEYYLGVIKKYIVFEGRARRKEFWMFFLFNILAAGVLGFIEGLIFPPESSYLSSIYFLAVLLPTIAVSIRRIHDVNKSGWFSLIPFYNLYLFTSAGDTQENQYGPDPKI